METNIQQLKSDIKQLSAQQKELKALRKESFAGERTMSRQQATSKHQDNRYDLRLMHAARAVLRGRSLSEIEQHNRPGMIALPAYSKQIDKIIQRYVPTWGTATPVRAGQ